MSVIDGIFFLWLCVVTAVIIRHVALTAELVKQVRALRAMPREERQAAAQVDEWWQGYYAAPEGSPKREAFEARLRSAGVL